MLTLCTAPWRSVVLHGVSYCCLRPTTVGPVDPEAISKRKFGHFDLLTVRAGPEAVLLGKIGHFGLLAGPAGPEAVL